MSEFTNHKEIRIARLVELFRLVISQELTSGSVQEYQQVIDRVCPADVIAVVDQLVQLQIPMPQLKKGINKALNLIHKSLKAFPYTHPESNSYFYWMIKNNEQIDFRLKAIRISTTG